MDHHDHVNLLRPGIPQPGGIWADFGSGRGFGTLIVAVFHTVTVGVQRSSLLIDFGTGRGFGSTIGTVGHTVTV